MIKLNENKPIKVMGVLNVTPDSFFDGGRFSSCIKAVDQAVAMQEAGASIIDIGGESTRPGASVVSVDEELSRVVPIIEAIRKKTDIQISIDTSKPQVMKEAVRAGANIINDVRALSIDGALEVAVELKVSVCLMHMQGQPLCMQNNPAYESIVDDVLEYLEAQVARCLLAGVDMHRIWIDPGFGFGKSLAHNLVLLKHLNRFSDTGFPVLVGMSRKSMIGDILDVPVEDRLTGSLALASLAAMNGASIIRAHDVKETVQVVKICQAIQLA